MRRNSLHRGTAVAARFAGLGMATTLALAIGSVPAVALAEEATPAGEAPAAAEAPVEEVPEASAPTSGATSEQAVADAASAGNTIDTTANPTPTSEEDGAGAATQTSAETQGAANSSTASADSAPGAATDAMGSAEPTRLDATVKSYAPAEQSQRAGSAQTVPANVTEPAADVPSSTDGASAAQSKEVVSVSATAQAPAQTTVTYTNVYRLYNPNSGEHFYTTSLGEATSVFSKGWRWEEAVYLEADKSDTPVYRLYNPNAGAHFYTINEGESNYLRSLGWRYENIAFYASGNSLLYRLYNPNSPIGEHLYTSNVDESNHLRSVGWRYEGYAWAFTPGRHNISGQWVVSPTYGSLERYWVASDTTLAKNRYVETSEGSGWRAYAKSSGAVVRGFYKVDSTRGLIADNNGALETGNGMVVTGKYTNGTLQRYYLTNGYVKLGEFSVNGKRYFGRSDTGYVVHNSDYFDPNTGKMYRGDNDGVLQARNTAKDRYVDWALAIAKDNRHGYSQIHRDGPDYDCSSLVIHALRQAGYRTGGASYTGNMYSELSRYGWYSVSPNPANLQYGDILLNDTHHTAIYLANGWLVQASSDENGSWQGYRSGDQTGREIYYRNYYNYPWTRILRHA